MKKYKPTTPSRRGMTVVDYSVLTRKKPEKKLISKLHRKRGRSKTTGQITTRHKGGGTKRLYRQIDSLREKFDIPAKVKSIEYDPNRTAFIALLSYRDGEKRYILSPFNLKIGDEIVSSIKTPIKIGNRMQLKNIPVGTQVHDIELYPGRGGKLVKSAGSYATVMATEGGYTHLQFPSKEIRMVPDRCMATVGQISNPEWEGVVIGKAGRSRWLGIRPTVRGSAMTPRDHPHGGGEGRALIGLKKGPKTPWGKLARGVRTRKKKWSDRFIIKRRK